jgi:hypothetical protein
MASLGEVDYNQDCNPQEGHSALDGDEDLFELLFDLIGESEVLQVLDWAIQHCWAYIVIKHCV